jgi:hypothetical protein
MLELRISVVTMFLSTDTVLDGVYEKRIVIVEFLTRMRKMAPRNLSSSYNSSSYKSRVSG